MTQDRRTARTQRMLHDALIVLILRKGYDAVTVQDIIDEADIGRSTFYAHYTGKEDLLRSGFQALRSHLANMRRSMAAARRDGTKGEMLGFSLAMFEHACEYKHVYRALLGGRGGAVASREIRRILTELVQEELSAVRRDGAMSRELTVEFVVGSFLTVLGWWLQQKVKPTPAQVDTMFRRLIINGIGSSIQSRFPGD